MTTGATGIQVYQDGEGNLYLRVPDEQREAVEQALAEHDTTGYVGGGGAGGQGVVVQGGLWARGSIGQLPHAGLTGGIIIIGGRLS
jgi:hypothetical protein